MADIGKAYVQIVPSAKNISGQIQSVLRGEVDAAGEESGQSFGSKFVAVAKRIIAAAGLGKFISDSLNAGGALQQSFGGIDTLYGNASESAKQYALEASKAGISANTYAEQAVSFGAALKQAFKDAGDETVQQTLAAEAANMAIMDMADNSAKFGTDISAVQNAYQGFARQQYQMLDSLRLGYGGSRAEMERLLADAEKLTGVHYDIDNLGDVYAAIHEIQKELGVAGVAADEAATTFSGSMGAVKAAFENVMAGLALGMDITPQLEILAQSATNFLFGNLIPMLGNIFSGLPTMIGTILSTGMPILFENGMALIESLKNGVVANIPNVISQALPMILNFVQTLRSNFGQMVDAGIDLILNIVDGLIAGLPDLIAYVPEIVTNIAGVINDNMPKIFGMGIEIIGKLIMGLANNLPNLLSNMGNIMMAAWNVVTAINWLSLGSQVLKAIINGIKSLASSLPSALKSIAQSGWNAFKSIDWVGVGSAIINGIVSGITAFGGMIKNTLMGLAESAWSAVKSFFGIASPSKLMADTIGKYIPMGMAEGIEDNAKYVTDAMADIATDASQFPIEQSLSISSGLGSLASTGNTTNYGGVSINIMASDFGSAEELFEYIRDRLTSETIRQNEVFA